HLKEAKVKRSCYCLAPASSGLAPAKRKSNAVAPANQVLITSETRNEGQVTHFTDGR
ncbi:hypothetical protein HAX54_002096, partial [Datura stramonium]|nr:hypothetical protein [Datura stramonium]